jgi:hypothetical protein
MKTTIKLMTVAVLWLLSAIPSFADGWKSGHITNVYSGIYENKERVIISTDIPGTFYLDLSPTESSRLSTSILVSALYKGNGVSIYVTSKYINGSQGPANYWYEVTHVAVAR